MRLLCSALLSTATAASLALGLVPDVAYAAGETATAAMKLADGADAGTITLTQANGLVVLKLDLKGLKPGAHGLHVHEVGTCDGDFSSAGAIYNPLGAKHGFLSDEGPMAGDLPNVVAGADGTALGEIISPFLNLNKDVEEPLIDADGVALVLDEKPDDYQTDPEGGAEPRIACGALKAR